MTKQKLVVLAVRGSLSADSEWAFSCGHWSWHDEVPLSVRMEKGRIVRLQENWVWALVCRLISCFQARQVSGATEWCEISAEQQIEERDLWDNLELLIALAVVGPIKQLDACFVDGLKGINVGIVLHEARPIALTAGTCFAAVAVHDYQAVVIP